MFRIKFVFLVGELTTSSCILDLKKANWFWVYQYKFPPLGVNYIFCELGEYSNAVEASPIMATAMFGVGQAF